MIYHSKDSNTIVLLTKDSIPIGEIKTTPVFIEYSLNDIFAINRIKILNTEAIYSATKVKMYFRNTYNFNPSLKNNFDNLLYSKIIHTHSEQHDKEDKKRNIESVEEIFVEDINYLNDLGEVEYTNKRGMPRESSISNDYLKNPDYEIYYPPNEEIINGLEQL